MTSTHVQAGAAQPRVPHNVKINKLISEFPSVEEIDKNPEIILSGRFMPHWVHSAVLIEAMDRIYASLFKPTDGNRAVVVTLKRSPGKEAIRMDLWAYAWAVLATAPGGTIVLNNNGNPKQTYVRFRRAAVPSPIDKGAMRDLGPVPLARLLFDPEIHQAARYLDGDRRNLFHSNLIGEVSPRLHRYPTSRADVEHNQVMASGFHPELAVKLKALWERGEEERRDVAAHLAALV